MRGAQSDRRRSQRRRRADPEEQCGAGLLRFQRPLLSQTTWGAPFSGKRRDAANTTS